MTKLCGMYFGCGISKDNFSENKQHHTFYDFYGQAGGPYSNLAVEEGQP